MSVTLGAVLRALPSEACFQPRVVGWAAWCYLRPGLPEYTFLQAAANVHNSCWTVGQLLENWRRTGDPNGYGFQIGFGLAPYTGDITLRGCVEFRRVWAS